MKKVVHALTIFLVLLITGCEKNPEIPLPISADSLITMENVDDYLNRDDVQYVDLRNFDSRFSNGYIVGFESIPFFDYLDYRLFDRNGTYEFSEEQILDEAYIRDLFDIEKSIFLYADGCIRSGYLKDLLNYLGYEKVFVLGGYYDYEGENVVLGDDTFKIGDTFYAKYYDEQSHLEYIMYGTFDISRKITSIRFDILDEDGISLRSPNYNVEMNYNEQLTTLEEFIVFDIVTFNELYYFITVDTSSVYYQIQDYTLGYNAAFISLLSLRTIS